MLLDCDYDIEAISHYNYDRDISLLDGHEIHRLILGYCYDLLTRYDSDFCQYIRILVKKSYYVRFVCVFI
jgi:hypothetical protein